MIISEIVGLDKKKSKVSIDGSFAFVLYKGEIRHYKLKAGEEIFDSSYVEIMETLLVKRGKARAMYLLKDMDRTEKELRDKLEKNFYPDEVIDKVLEYVKGYGYIDDERYCKQYIHVFSERKSRRKLLYDLAKKGISKELSTSLLEGEEIDEIEQIRKWLLKKKYSSAEFNYQEKQKLGVFLARKGYQFDNIQKAMGNFTDYE